MLEESTWRGVATGDQPAWEWRARIIGKLIRPSDTVFDFGAGNRKLQRFIPPSCGYVPIDAVDTLPGTFVCDYNKEFRLPDDGLSVAVCAGFLEYIEDVPAFFSNLRAAAPGAITVFSYLISPTTATRSTMLTRNSYTTAGELLEVLSSQLSNIRIVTRVHETIIVSATLGHGGEASNWTDGQSLDDIFSRAAKSGFAGKLVRSVRKRIG